jgi:hypothetical protein
MVIQIILKNAKDNNSGGSMYTKLDCPWKLIMLLLFKDKLRATSFEKCLKSGAGRAFAKKDLVKVVYLFLPCPP